MVYYIGRIEQLYLELILVEAGTDAEAIAKLNAGDFQILHRNKEGNPTVISYQVINL